MGPETRTLEMTSLNPLLNRDIINANLSMLCFCPCFVANYLRVVYTLSNNSTRVSIDRPRVKGVPGVLLPHNIMA
jgi:hypothetical protein